MITIYTLAYNEEFMIGFMIGHYRERFPGCKIVIYDNMSTDNTVEIARSEGCEVISFDTKNQLRDDTHAQIKNTCWKNAKTDWILACDMDELLEINATDLKKEEGSGTTIIRSEAYEMINMDDNWDIAGIKYGVRDPFYDKSYLFNKKFISEMNYTPGAHTCSPVGNVIYSKKVYRLYHYSSVNEKLTYEKCLAYGTRLSPENIINGWGLGRLVTSKQNTPEMIHEEFVLARQQAVKVR